MKFKCNESLPDLEKSGIYEIINIQDGKRYIGSTECFSKRMREHFSALFNKRHYNKHLQQSFDKYGAALFEFKIIIFCEKSECVLLEQKYLDDIFKTKESRKQHYNISKVAGKPPIRYGSEHHFFGRKHSPETKEKISKSHSGKPGLFGVENPMYGRRFSHTEEAKEKIRQAVSGEKNVLYGKNLSEEIKRKISETKSGKSFGKDNPNYISAIIAKNIVSGEVLIAHSISEMAKKLNVGTAAVYNRINKGSRDYIENPIKNVWMLCREENICEENEMKTDLLKRKNDLINGINNNKKELEEIETYERLKEKFEGNETPSLNVKGFSPNTTVDNHQVPGDFAEKYKLKMKDLNKLLTRYLSEKYEWLKSQSIVVDVSGVRGVGSTVMHRDFSLYCDKHGCSRPSTGDFYQLLIEGRPGWERYDVRGRKDSRIYYSHKSLS